MVLRSCCSLGRGSGSVVAEAGSDELGLGDYVGLYRRRWRWVLGTVVVVFGAVALITFTRDEVYQSRSRVIFLTDETQTVFNVRDEALFRNGFAELSYVSGDAFENRVDDLAGFEVDVTASLLTVDPNQESESASILSFVVRDQSPQRAAAGAEAAANAYLEGRVEDLVASIEAPREVAIEELDMVRERRGMLNDELRDLTEAADDAPDEATRLELLAERDQRELELQPTLENLSLQLGQLTAEINTLDEQLATLERPGSVARLSNPANVPREPVSPDVPQNLLLGLIAGVVLGLILAIVRDLLDTRARDGEELAQLVDIPVMAAIGEIRSQRNAPGRIRRYRDLSSEEASGYEVLLNSLWLSNVDSPLQSIVFTSDRPGVGKTQTVVNLAQAEAARGTRVLVIDTDFANPSVADRLEVPPSDFGLADLLIGSATMESVVVPTGLDNLSIIDQHGASSAELLRSDRLAGLLRVLQPSFDLILLDSPPTLSAADSRLVASQADAVVVVYDPAQSRRDELQRTIDLLHGARANLIGLVANRSRSTLPFYASGRVG